MIPGNPTAVGFQAGSTCVHIVSEMVAWHVPVSIATAPVTGTHLCPHVPWGAREL